MGLVDVYRNVGKDIYTYGTFDESGNAKSPAESFADDMRAVFDNVFLYAADPRHESRAAANKALCILHGLKYAKVIRDLAHKMGGILEQLLAKIGVSARRAMTLAEREMEAVKMERFEKMSTDDLALPGSPGAADAAARGAPGATAAVATGAAKAAVDEVGRKGKKEASRAGKGKGGPAVYSFAHELKAFYREKQKLERSKEAESQKDSPKTPSRKTAGGKGYVGGRKRALEGGKDSPVQSSPEKKSKGWVGAGVEERERERERGLGLGGGRGRGQSHTHPPPQNPDPRRPALRHLLPTPPQAKRSLCS